MAEEAKKNGIFFLPEKPLADARLDLPPKKVQM